MNSALTADDYPPAEEFAAIIYKTGMEKPSEEAIAELRRMIQRCPEAWRLAGDMARIAGSHIVDQAGSTPLIREFLKLGVEATRRDLGYDDAPALERLLIEQVVLSWLRLNLLEYQYSDVMHAAIPIARAGYRERRLSAAQHRFLRACETLARVRKLMRRTPALQVNIAASGGQQVNVAGDVSDRA